MARAKYCPGEPPLHLFSPSPFCPEKILTLRILGDLWQAAAGICVVPLWGPTKKEKRGEARPAAAPAAPLSVRDRRKHQSLVPLLCIGTHSWSWVYSLRRLLNLFYIFACKLRNSSFLIWTFYGDQKSAVSSSYILWWHFSDSFTIHQVVFLDMLSLLRLLFYFPREHNDFLLCPLMIKLCPSLRKLSGPSPLLHSAELWLTPTTYIILILFFNWMNWLI